MTESLITVGKVLKEWGVKGELLVLPLTYDPDRFFLLKSLAIQSGDEIQWRALKSVRHHKGMLLLGIDGCNSPEDARRYRGALLKIKMSDSPKLPEGIYYQYQIIGLDVYTDKGEYLGQVESIVETGSNDVYVVKGKYKAEEYLIPAIKDVILMIDLEANRMIVRLMEIVE